MGKPEAYRLRGTMARMHVASLPTELRQRALSILGIADFEQKSILASDLIDFVAINNIAIDAVLTPTVAIPGRMSAPVLVPAGSTPRRSVHSRRGRATLIHAIAHIECNAINLALDAVWRFAGMPPDYYQDWARVASEEALHFKLLRGLLQHMGHDYGDFEAHDGLWDMVERTRGDVTARMALVPRTLEARGLDATPLIATKLQELAANPQRCDPHAADDAARACAILDIILRDEIGHVAIGNHWFGQLCAKTGLDPIAHYAQLLNTHQAPRLKAPFNLTARRKAGFSEQELDALLEQAVARTT